MESLHPHSNELQTLERRLRVCSNLQKLSETSLAKWASLVPELEMILNADWWPIFPMALKLKITHAKAMTLMDEIRGIRPAEEPAIKAHVAFFVGIPFASKSRR